MARPSKKSTKQITKTKKQQEDEIVVKANGARKCFICRKIIDKDKKSYQLINSNGMIRHTTCERRVRTYKELEHEVYE